MRRPIALCAFMLTLITGVWLGQAYTLFAPIAPIAAEDTAARSAVSTAWRFYDAVGLLLRTGDHTALRGIVAPDFVDHVDEPGTPADRDGLVRYLTAMRDTYPTLHLTPQDIVAQGDRVFARIEPTGSARGAILGIPLAGKEPWPRVDMLRVQDGQVVERWGDPAGYAPATVLFSETLTYAHHGDLVPMLRRVTVAPGVLKASFAQATSAIISVESGELVITTAGEVAPASGAGTVPTQAGTQTRILTAGDAFAIANGGDVSFANRTATPTVLLAFTSTPPAPAAPQAGGEDPSSVFVDAPEGISIQELTGSTTVTTNPGRLSIELARVTLAPGARLADHPAEGSEMVIVDAGTVTATIAQNPESAWLRNPNGRSVAARGAVQIAAGSNLAVTEGAGVSYTNEATRPASLLLLTIAPG